MTEKASVRSDGGSLTATNFLKKSIASVCMGSGIVLSCSLFFLFPTFKYPPWSLGKAKDKGTFFRRPPLASLVQWTGRGTPEAVCFSIVGTGLLLRMRASYSNMITHFLFLVTGAPAARQTQFGSRKLQQGDRTDCSRERDLPEITPFKWQWWCGCPSNCEMMFENTLEGERSRAG